MVGVILPDCGGACVPPDGGGGPAGNIPLVISDKISEHSQNGVVLSGIVAWIEVQLDTVGNTIWRPLADKSWSESEISTAKEALRATCGQDLINLYPDFKTNRQGGNKKLKEIDDIVKAIQALQTNNKMPLVLASSGMMGRCPSSWGQPENPTCQDIMGKFHMVEEVLSSFMVQQKQQMETLRNELASVKHVGSRTPSILTPQVTISETPSKKRKINDETNVQQHAYSQVVVGGVQPLPGQSSNVANIQRQPSNISSSYPPKPKTPRQQRNILYGTSKFSGDQSTEKLLAADVDLVATGVSKDCSDDDLKGFLTSKGIDVIAVETLTKAEVLPMVRTKTFKVTVKAAQYEKVLKPDIWPYRVAVRHYKAPKRSEQSWGDQSKRSGGVITDNPHAKINQGGHNLPQQPPVTPVNVSNQFDILRDLGSKEVQAH